MARERVMSIVLDPLRRESSAALDVIRILDAKRRKELLDTPGFSPRDWPPVDPTYLKTYKEYRAKERPAVPSSKMDLISSRLFI